MRNFPCSMTSLWNIIKSGFKHEGGDVSDGETNPKSTAWAVETAVDPDGPFAGLPKLFTDRSMVAFYKRDESVVIKYGSCVKLSEAETMRYVRENSQCPVPQVYDAYVDEKGNTAIVMEYIKGTPLDQAWDTMSQEAKSCVVSQLKDIMASLHTLSNTYIGSLHNGPCLDFIFDDYEQPGPFANMQEFHKAIKETILQKDDSGLGDTIVTFLDLIEGQPIVFCHGDFSPRNIMVDQDGKVVSILDWEYAGFYPAYWEYVKAMYRPDWDSDWIRKEVIGTILAPKVKELAVMMHVRQTVW